MSKKQKIEADLKETLERMQKNVERIVTAYGEMHTEVEKTKNEPRYDEKWKQKSIEKQVRSFIVRIEDDYNQLQRIESEYNRHVGEYNACIDFTDPLFQNAMTFLRTTGGKVENAVLEEILEAVPLPSQRKQLAELLPDNATRMMMTKAAEDAALPVMGGLGDFDMEIYMTNREEGRYMPSHAAMCGAMGVVEDAIAALPQSEGAGEE